MKAKRRDKQTCFRCRAMHISPKEAGCLLGWDTEVKNQPGGVSFYAPAAGVKCPKPMTHGELTDAVAAQAREKKNDHQIRLPPL